MGGCRTSAPGTAEPGGSSGKRQRRIILRAEHNTYWGANPRFLVTSLEGF